MLKVLVADDDPLILRLVDNTLSAQGYSVLLAADGREALDLARQERPQIVILDAMMPGCDGLSVLQSLKQRSAFRKTRVMMLTARTSEGHVLNALRLGADDYVTKPFTAVDLVARVRRLARAMASGRAGARPAQDLDVGDVWNV
jgi:two-component system alkaline phosphatase synthesis response regulator PhoP